MSLLEMGHDLIDGLFLICVSICLHVCLDTTLVHAVPEEARGGHQTPLKWSYHVGAGVTQLNLGPPWKRGQCT